MGIQEMLSYIFDWFCICCFYVIGHVDVSDMRKVILVLVPFTRK
jgi:hypothetical protein